MNIHYLWVPIGGVADWENQRATRFVPLVQSSSSPSLSVPTPAAEVTSSSPAPLRKKILKLPQRILDPQSGTLTDRYLLLHSFEVLQDSRRYYSPLYSEEIVTDANTQSAALDAISERPTATPLTTAYADVKKSEK